jgi:hypothetical protein
MHSCEKTAINGCSWPNFWANLVSFSLLPFPKEKQRTRAGGAGTKRGREPRARPARPEVRRRLVARVLPQRAVQRLVVLYAARRGHASPLANLDTWHSKLARDSVLSWSAGTRHYWPIETLGTPNLLGTASCCGARARVTTDQFRHLALRTGLGHRVSTNILANQMFKCKRGGPYRTQKNIDPLRLIVVFLANCTGGSML